MSGVRRKWGTYYVLLRTKWLCIKLVAFDKHGHLQEQLHRHRNELWLFLYGGLFFQKSYGKIDAENISEKENWLYREIVPRTDKMVMAWSRGSRIKNIILVRKNERHKCFAFTKSYVLEIQYGSDVRESDIERF